MNGSPDEEMLKEIQLDAGCSAGPVAVRVVDGPRARAANSFEHPHVVGVRDVALQASGTRFDTSFEPHTVTAQSFDLA